MTPLARTVASALPLLAAWSQHGAPRSADHVPGVGDAVYELPPGGVPIRVPFRLLANQVRLDATIEGKGPFHLVLDTGMPVPGIILFQSPAVEALGLHSSGQSVGLSG